MLAAPVPQTGAPCGLVDWLDFPLDPPDAASILAGGRDFGLFRQRYDLYHAGEDWWTASRGNSFGEPVYSVGHGSVTYAEPNGWGRDQGVVIIRHFFADGRSYLSFYGHLDPPSVTLHAGDCVTRGMKVGEIGRPRTPPHLHFELRTHMPTEPGPGYWAEDPTLAGWLPPSQTIWHERIVSSPGVIWTISGNDVRQLVGQLAPDTLLFLESTRLVGLDAVTGAMRWQSDALPGVVTAALDSGQELLYGATRAGKLLAYRAPANGIFVPEPAWEFSLERPGVPTLIPAPTDGVLVAMRDTLYSLSAQGTLRWQQDMGSNLFAWTSRGQQLIVTTTGSQGQVWLLDGDAPPAPLAAGGGYPLAVQDALWLYAEDGLYRLDSAADSSVVRLQALPYASLTAGSITALSNGTVLLAHTDIYDRRLIALDSSGQLQWQYSLRMLPRGTFRLVVSADQPYMILQGLPGNTSQVDVYAIDAAHGQLTRIFSGGTRQGRGTATWSMPLADNLLINIGGGDMLLLDPLAAETAVSPDS